MVCSVSPLPQSEKEGEAILADIQSEKEGEAILADIQSATKCILSSVNIGVVYFALVMILVKTTAKSFRFHKEPISGFS